MIGLLAIMMLSSPIRTPNPGPVFPSLEGHSNIGAGSGPPRSICALRGSVARGLVEPFRLKAILVTSGNGSFLYDQACPTKPLMFTDIASFRGDQTYEGFESSTDFYLLWKGVDFTELDAVGQLEAYDGGRRQIFQATRVISYRHFWSPRWAKEVRGLLTRKRR